MSGSDREKLGAKLKSVFARQEPGLANDALIQLTASQLKRSREFVRLLFRGSGQPPLRENMTEILEYLETKQMLEPGEGHELAALYFRSLGIPGADAVVALPKHQASTSVRSQEELIALLGFPHDAQDEPTDPDQSEKFTEWLSQPLDFHGHGDIPKMLLALYHLGRARFRAYLDDMSRPTAARRNAKATTTAFYASLFRSRHLNITLEASLEQDGIPCVLSAFHSHEEEAQIDLVLFGSVTFWCKQCSKDKPVGIMAAGETCFVRQGHVHSFVGTDAVKMSVTFNRRALSKLARRSWRDERSCRILARPQTPPQS